MTATASAIALGSNLGDSLATLRAAVSALEAHSQVVVTAVSSVYLTAPLGPPQPDIFNACVLLETTLTAPELLNLLLAIEATFGRVRSQHWGPRTLDLDLLLFGQQILSTAKLQLPHPRMWERGFVLVPLAEIAPDWRNPLSGQTVAEISAVVDHAGVKRLPDVSLLFSHTPKGSVVR
ncbi:MAG: 2-amino-4-hydroxy-6-hydroxymethyldihydropteridine diphosphokinase [Cyanobacteria bacterium P01_C01_bin.120]